MEVIYTGIRQSPQMIVQAAAQEDVDVLGLSILSGAHLEILPEVMTLLHGEGMDDVLVVVGGIIPAVDRQRSGSGITRSTGTSTGEIVEFIRESMAEKV
ncbi:Ethylmalonyl-CoA mutase [Geodia barretti]|uniref:Ethylmalonyl-CoA mutase n=1 Tax=Geodia barretti TaxID=519541 RepID=A0AA35TS47_GEOBA|nr:Ethylmalonyl-CoA mutase [Geodia barretti]